MIGVVKKPYFYGAFALIGVAAWALASAGGAIMSGHPSYWVMYLMAVTLGLLVVMLAVIWRSSPTRVLLAGLGTPGLALLATLTWWLTPLEATERALAAMESDDSVRVASSTSAITMTPVGTSTGVGVIFHPGAGSAPGPMPISGDRLPRPAITSSS